MVEDFVGGFVGVANLDREIKSVFWFYDSLLG